MTEETKPSPSAPELVAPATPEEIRAALNVLARCTSPIFRDGGRAVPLRFVALSIRNPKDPLPLNIDVSDGVGSYGLHSPVSLENLCLTRQEAFRSSLRNHKRAITSYAKDLNLTISGDLAERIEKFGEDFTERTEGVDVTPDYDMGETADEAKVRVALELVMSAKKAAEAYGEYLSKVDTVRASDVRSELHNLVGRFLPVATLLSTSKRKESGHGLPF